MIDHFHPPLPIALINSISVRPVMIRPGTSFTCPECGALNVVVLGNDGPYITRICEGCGKEVESSRVHGHMGGSWTDRTSI